jgi:hypothetical protein
MAVSASRTERALMLIVFLVTRDASHGCVFEIQRLVTCFAFNRIMLSEQWKARLAVVEFHVFPATLHMAVSASRTERALMLIVLFVARHASGSKFFTI